MPGVLSKLAHPIKELEKKRDQAIAANDKKTAAQLELKAQTLRSACDPTEARLPQFTLRREEKLTRVGTPQSLRLKPKKQKKLKNLYREMELSRDPVYAALTGSVETARKASLRALQQPVVHAMPKNDANVKVKGKPPLLHAMNALVNNLEVVHSLIQEGALIDMRVDGAEGEDTPLNAMVSLMCSAVIPPEDDDHAVEFHVDHQRRLAQQADFFEQAEHFYHDRLPHMLLAYFPDGVNRTIADYVHTPNHVCTHFARLRQEQRADDVASVSRASRSSFTSAVVPVVAAPEAEDDLPELISRVTLGL